MQVIQLHLVFCLVGNITSVYFPYKIGGKKQAGTNIQQILVMATGIVVMGVLGVLTLPSTFGMMIDAFLSAFTEYEGISIGFLVSAATLVATMLVYRYSLKEMGELLQEREQTILGALARDKE